MTKPFLSLTEVAQLATDRVEQVMHLPPDGESRHTPSPEQSYGPRALGEAGGLPVTPISQGSSDGAHAEQGNNRVGYDCENAHSSPFAKRLAVRTVPVLKDPLAASTQSGSLEQSLGAEAGIVAAPGAGAGLAGTAPAVSFQVGDYFADERFLPNLRIVGIVVDVRGKYVEGAIITRATGWQFETRYVAQGEDLVKLEAK